MRNTIVALFAIAFCSFSWGQTQSGTSSASQAMPGMDMGAGSPGMSEMKDENIEKDDAAAAAHAMHSMEGHMDMGPHMKMTTLRTTEPGDLARARGVAEEARKAAMEYLDYKVALSHGFKIFLPNIPQKIYHFTNYVYGAEAEFRFNPEHPTSLLYEKHGDDYKLIGVMYTAPKWFNEDQLNERIPLSVVQWHEHVNFCIPPLGRRKEMLQPHPQFGLRGSISTQEACDAAGGTFHPVIFDRMVHVYPFEKDQASIWSVDRQHGDSD